MKNSARTGVLAGVAALALALLPVAPSTAATPPASDSESPSLTSAAPTAPVKKGRIKFCTTGAGVLNYEADGGDKVREGSVDTNDCDSFKVPKGKYEVVLTEIERTGPDCVGPALDEVVNITIDAPNGDRTFKNVGDELEFKTKVGSKKTTTIRATFACVTL